MLGILHLHLGLALLGGRRDHDSDALGEPLATLSTLIHAANTKDLLGLESNGVAHFTTPVGGIGDAIGASFMYMEFSGILPYVNSPT